MILVVIAFALMALLFVGMGMLLIRILQIAVAVVLVFGVILLNLIVFTSIGAGTTVGAIVSALAGPGNGALPWLVGISVGVLTALLLLRALVRHLVAWLKSARLKDPNDRPQLPTRRLPLG